MAIRKSGDYCYADAASDIEESIKALPETEDMVHFRQSICAQCRHAVFRLYLDEDAGFCLRECVRCNNKHILVDGEDVLEEAVPEQVQCICELDEFEVVGACNVYDDSPHDARQFALGCRCVSCGVAGVYAIWSARCVGDEEEPGWVLYLDGM